jgi:hypothetical protein
MGEVMIVVTYGVGTETKPAVFSMREVCEVRAECSSYIFDGSCRTRAPGVKVGAGREHDMT